MADEQTAKASTVARAKPDEEIEPELGPRADQHPALHDDPEGEVASRSADGSDGMTFRKVFVMAGPAEIPSDHPCHEANAVRVLEEALQRGLHPKGEASLVGTEVVDETRRGPVSTACTYEVAVEPAVTDREAHTTVAPSSGVREKKARGTES